MPLFQLTTDIVPRFLFYYTITKPVSMGTRETLIVIGNEYVYDEDY